MEKKYNEIQLTKNKMDLNIRKITNYLPSPGYCGLNSSCCICEDQLSPDCLQLSRGCNGEALQQSAVPCAAFQGGETQLSCGGDKFLIVRATNAAWVKDYHLSEQTQRVFPPGKHLP